MVKKSEKLQAALAHSLTLISFAVVIAALYFGKEILLPVALAILLSFILKPLVTALERLRLGRVPSVILVTVLAFSLFAGVGWIATSQVVELSQRLPVYKQNLIEKIRSVRGKTGGQIEEAKKALDDIGEELTKGEDDAKDSAEPVDENQSWIPWPIRQPKEEKISKESAASKGKEDAVAVKVVELPPSPLSQIKNWLGPLVAPLSTTGLVIVLVIFILIKREDLRNRVLSLIGRSRFYATTEAMDEATRRLSAYLRMQLLINMIYGIVMAVGLFFIGIPNALLWGIVGMLLRFLPYVGPWIAASMPILLSLSVSDGWTQPLLTIGMFVALELVVNNVLEPWLYGSSAGVSSFGVIVAAIFWTWLWGPIGLVLAVPLTVCLIVLGNYVPAMNFISVLLGDRSTLLPHEQLYQRFLTSNDAEASRHADEYLSQNSLVSFYDKVVSPALEIAEVDRHFHRLSERQEALVGKSAQELVEEIRDREEFRSPEPKEDALRVLCVPAHNTADQITSMMMAQLLAIEGFHTETRSLDLLVSEMVQRVEEGDFDAVAISFVPPFGTRKTKYLCQRLRQAFPNLHIVVVAIARKELKRTSKKLLQAGANTVVFGLSNANATFQSYRRHLAYSQPTTSDDMAPVA